MPVPSLLHGVPVVTTSARSAFRRCPQRWWWQYVEGLQPRGDAPDALWFGIGIHEALAQWYLPGKKRGPHPADTFEDWHGDQERRILAQLPDREYDEGERAKYEDALALGVSMLEDYVETYDRDGQWSIIAVEHPFVIKVMRNGKIIAYFASTWDGVERDEADGRVYLVEHKTAGQVQLPYLELDDQAGIYWAIATAVLRARGVLGPKESIRGIKYNFLRKSLRDERPQNEFGEYLNKNGTVSLKQPPPRYVRHLVERSPSERRTQMQRLSDEVAWMMAMINGTMPVIKYTTKECTYCPFFTMCKLHERGGDKYQTIARIDFRKGEPFDRYLKSAAA